MCARRDGVGLLETHVVRKHDGLAVVLREGQLLRLTQPEGPQVIDFNAFNLDNPWEHLGSSVTRRRETIHPTTGTKLWTRPPWERPMLEVTADTVEHQPSPSGAVTHDMLSGRCCAVSRVERYGIDSPGCQEILAKAVESFGLDGNYVHDPFNIFMRTGIDENGRTFWEEPFDVKAGDCIDMRALMPCIVAVSACPGRSSGPGERALGLEIYEAG
ncbi:MAG: urea carboxylase-associated family protein [Chloroflexi bacterium]|nr:urea carboxylase-associated family protein [Chloroflexota bacterium]